MESTDGGGGGGGGPSPASPMRRTVSFRSEREDAPGMSATSGSGGSADAEAALQKLQVASTTLQREGRYLEALECMERMLTLEHRLYGARAPQTLHTSKAAGELCNLLAMTYLQREEFTMVSELLKKAEGFTQHDAAGRAVTLNNLACFSRQQGRLHAALSFLQKAVDLEAALPHVPNAADTHLNLCAVLSQLERHKEALYHAQAALLLMQEELFGAGEPTAASHKPERIAVLAICYHNIGVECEFMKHYPASLQAYAKGVEIASVYLGAEHGITQTLKRSKRAASAAVAKAEERRANRTGSPAVATGVAATGVAATGAATTGAATAGTAGSGGAAAVAAAVVAASPTTRGVGGGGSGKWSGAAAASPLRSAGAASIAPHSARRR